jgi:UDP-2,3-diacylglucosamine pyrophosphatase LpxH
MHDLIVLSDLHMGRGINPDTRKFYTLENFFFDEDFARLCDYLCRDAANRAVPFKLIFNGDTFDLLRIDTLPQEHGTPWHEQRFGPPHTPEQAAITISEIMRGHKAFVRGLGQVLNAGHEVIFLPGNHDIEMQWAPVQAQVRQALMEAIQLAYGEQAAKDAGPLLRFLPWFYHEPTRIWIEHGCQYDPENSFKYLLRGSLANGVAGADAQAVAYVDTEQDMPLGNFFQRYLYNAFGHITFIVPSTRANIRYVKWLLLNAPSLLFRVIFSHGPFVFQVLRRLSRQSDKAAQRALEQAHAQALEQLSQDSGLSDRLRAIDSLKEVRADAVQAAKSLGWQALKMLSSTLLFAVLVAGLWFFGLYFITELAVSIGPKALLFLFMTLLLALATAGAILWLMVGSPVDVPPRPMRRAAARIAALLDVAVVSFGHSHDEEIWRLDRPEGSRAWYCNTGTWIAVFTHDVLMPRERVQYTFLRVQGTEAALMHWSPGRGEPLAVVLLDEGDPPADL